MVSAVCKRSSRRQHGKVFSHERGTTADDVLIARRLVCVRVHV